MPRPSAQNATPRMLGNVKVAALVSEANDPEITLRFRGKCGFFRRAARGVG